jgi:hypothetical protein
VPGFLLLAALVDATSYHETEQRKLAAPLDVADHYVVNPKQQRRRRDRSPNESYRSRRYGLPAAALDGNSYRALSLAGYDGAGPHSKRSEEHDVRGG